MQKLITETSQVKAIIFDMDGVLLDSEPLHLKAYQLFLQNFGITFTEEDNRPFLGRKDLELATHLISQHGIEMNPLELVDEKEKLMATLISAGISPMPGVVKVLQDAESLKISCGIASSATLPTIKSIVDALHISRYFQALTSGDEVENGKPAPDVYLLAAARLGVKPNQCLVIEDSQNGVSAAKAANMHCVAIPCATTQHQDHSRADKILDTLESLNLSAWVKTQDADNFEQSSPTVA